MNQGTNTSIDTRPVALSSMPKGTYTCPSLSISRTKVSHYILLRMAYPLTPCLAAPSATVTLFIFSYIPAYPLRTCSCIWSVRQRARFERGFEACPLANYQYQCEANPLLQVLLKGLVTRRLTIMTSYHLLPFSRKVGWLEHHDHDHSPNYQ